MPSPWEKTPQESWAMNFRQRITAVTENIEGSVDDYETGVQEAFERAGEDVNVSADSLGVANFADAVDEFSDEAMRRATITAAGQYLENNDVPVSTSGVAGVTEYDDSSDSAEAFENATEVLGYKFVREWANSYE